MKTKIIELLDRIIVEDLSPRDEKGENNLMHTNIMKLLFDIA